MLEQLNVQMKFMKFYDEKVSAAHSLTGWILVLNIF